MKITWWSLGPRSIGPHQATLKLGWGPRVDFLFGTAHALEEEEASSSLGLQEALTPAASQAALSHAALSPVPGSLSDADTDTGTVADQLCARFVARCIERSRALQAQAKGDRHKLKLLVREARRTEGEEGQDIWAPRGPLRVPLAAADSASAQSEAEDQRQEDPMDWHWTPAPADRKEQNREEGESDKRCEATPSPEDSSKGPPRKCYRFNPSVVSHGQAPDPILFSSDEEADLNYPALPTFPAPDPSSVGGSRSPYGGVSLVFDSMV